MNIKNTFQFPNEWIDGGLMALLTGEEMKVLTALARKILGYAEKRKSMQDRISGSQLTQMTGLARSTVDAAVKMLTRCDVFQTGGTDHRGKIFLMDLSRPIKFDLLKYRSGYTKTANKNRVENARKSSVQFPVPQATDIEISTENRVSCPTGNSVKQIKDLHGFQGIQLENSVACGTATQNPDKGETNRLTGYKQDQKPTDFKYFFYKAMNKEKDKVKAALDISKRYNGVDGENAYTLFMVLSYFREIGAEEEIFNNWSMNWNFVRALGRDRMNTARSLLKEAISKGGVENAGALHTAKVKEVAAWHKITINSKRGMAKAPAASHQKMRAA